MYWAFLFDHEQDEIKHKDWCVDGKKENAGGVMGMIQTIVNDAETTAEKVIRVEENAMDSKLDDWDDEDSARICVFWT